MTTPEGKVRDYLLARCRKLGLKAFKLSFESTRGAPDWLILGMGHHIFVELKAEDGVISAAQENVFSYMRHGGGCKVFVCYTNADVDDSLKTMFSEHQWLERMF